MRKSIRQIRRDRHNIRRTRRLQAGRGNARRTHAAPAPIVSRALIQGAYSFLIQVGCSRQQISREFARLQRQRRSVITTQILSQEAHWLACSTRLIWQWCHELPYVNPTSGVPRRLRFEDGDPDLKSLIESHFPQEPAREVLSWLETHGGVVRETDGFYLPLRRARGATSKHEVQLVVLQTLQYLHAGLHRVRERDSTRLNPDRSTAVFRVPASCLIEARPYLSQQHGYLHENFAQWLKDHETQATDVPCVLVSLHGFLVVVPEAPRGK